MSGPACPLCGGAAPKTFVRERAAYTLWDCPDCGAGYCDPFENPGPQYYEHNRDVYPSDLEETTDAMSFEYDEGLALLVRALPRGARVLDVGCGAGGFLHRLKAAGFTAAGADFNARRVAALRARGFDVVAGGLPEAATAHPAPFDAVTMFEVLEHLDKPAAWLASARAVLKPGGLLVVGTPNRARTFDQFRGPGLEDVDNPPHHLTRWSADALRRLLERNGFAVEDCRALGYPRPLVQLMLRNALSFGLATRALNVDQLRHDAPAPAAAPAARRGLVRALVSAKSAAIDGAAALGYPFFRLAFRVLGWQGPVLLAAARVSS